MTRSHVTRDSSVHWQELILTRYAPVLLTIISMDTASPESHNRLRQVVIDEIKLSEASTRALKFRLNEFAPISRLPCEVLAAIFTYLSAFAWNDGSGLLAWICVAHVCRRWREIALNYPRFWSHINLTKLTRVGVAEILSRAKMAPLHLHMGHGTVPGLRKATRGPHLPYSPSQIPWMLYSDCGQATHSITYSYSRIPVRVGYLLFYAPYHHPR
jgi:hypothetical protein